MTIGYSGSYGINGTDFTLQPSTGKWNERDTLGIDGNGHPIYPQVREFNLHWALISTDDLSQIINFYNQCGNTGTVVADLPQWGVAGYQFYSYSGCTISEPTIGEYFNEFVTDVRLVIMKVRT